MEIIAKYWREILLILFAYHSLTSFSYIEDKVDDIDVAGWVDYAPQIKNYGDATGRTPQVDRRNLSQIDGNLLSIDSSIWYLESVCLAAM